MADSIIATPDAPLVLGGGDHEFDVVHIADGGRIEVAGAANVRIGRIENSALGVATPGQDATIVVSGYNSPPGPSGANGPTGATGPSGLVGGPGGQGGTGWDGVDGARGIMGPPVIFNFGQTPGTLTIHFEGGAGGAGGAGGTGGAGGAGGTAMPPAAWLPPNMGGPGGSGGSGGPGGHGGNGGDGADGPTVIVYVPGELKNLVITMDRNFGPGGAAGAGGAGGPGGNGNPPGPPGAPGAPGLSGWPGRNGNPGPVMVRKSA